MGFRNGAFATVWEVEQKSPTLVSVRISTSKKNKDTNTYEQDFSGYVAFVGTAAAQGAVRLKEKDRIKLGDVDVTTKYDAAKRVTYTNYKCFSFELQDSVPPVAPSNADICNEDFMRVPDGETNEDDLLPF